MQQPKQQRTYADLYSQQRSASPVAAAGSAGSNSSGRPLNPESVGAITAAASEQGRAVEGNNNNRQPSTFHAPKVASSAADVKAAGKPSSSRIPTYPGQSASRQHAAAAARPGRGGSPEPTSTRIPAAAAAAACAGANGVSHAAAATTRNDDDADGTTAAKASSTPEPSHHDQGPIPHSITPEVDSSDWSQDSSTSFELSSCSVAGGGQRGKHTTTINNNNSSSVQPNSRGSTSIHADSGDEQQLCHKSSSSSPQQHQQRRHGQQNGLEQPAQQQQQQQQGLQSHRLQDQGEHLQTAADKQQLEQQQQRANGGPGSSGTAAVPDSSTVRARMSADPDYELPQGKLTETQVLLAHGTKLQLDRYGFILGESDMAGRTAGAAAGRQQRTASQVRRDQRHVAKWRHMLGGSAADFEAYRAAKMAKVKRRVRKGIPDEFRGYVWQLLSGGHALMQSHPGMYARLLSHSPDAVDLEIMRDLNRTFPNHVFFHQRQGPGQQSLFHVLRAYSALDKEVGYVQGMGFVSAILLMYMSEEAAFWTLVALLKGTAAHPPLEGLYQAGMPLLQQSLYQFHELLKQEHPRLGVHLEQEGVVPSMYCTHWFNTLFAYSLPFEHLLRVWDVFLLEGMKVLFRVGIALLASAHDQLCAMPFERLVAALNSRKFPILKKNPDVLMKAALRIPVSKQLERLRERFLDLQAETQAAAAEAEGGSSRLAANGSGGASASGAAAAAGGTAASGGHGRSSSSHSSKSSAAHAQQQLIAGFAPVPMGPNS